MLLKMKILVATSNRHKKDELAALFQGASLSTPEEEGIPFSVEEDGSSFFENALIKARALFEAAGCPSLADDSGLCVDALNGGPGIYSARFGSEGGKLLSSFERNELLLAKMSGEANRKCRFVSCIVLYAGPMRFFCAQETLEGLLLEKPRGEGGFGYDPIVFLPDFGKSVAELSIDEKNKVSHRGKAARAIKAMLEGARLL